MVASFELLGPRWRNDRPLWVADVRVTEEPNRRSARLVYASNESRILGLSAKLPGTMLVHVQIDRVQLNLGNDQGPKVDALREVQTSFLVAADPQAWNLAVNAKIDKMSCLAGQFPLAPFFRDNLSNLPAFFRQRLSSIFGQDNFSNLQASSSGLLLDGKARMPDQANSFQQLLPFRLEPIRPQLDQPALGDFLLMVDRERLVEPKFAPGQSELQQYFQELVFDRLNPAIDKIPRMKWVRLELADATRLPKFHWQVSIADSKTRVVFADGEWKLFISDQSLAQRQISTRGVLTSTPTVSIEGNRLEVNGAKIEDTAVSEGKATYNWTATNGSEGWKIENVSLAYNPIEVANQLRRVYGLNRPRVDDIDEQNVTDGARLTGAVLPSDGKIDPAVLWGFLPTEYGWAQLPFLNCTEQTLADALPAYRGPDQEDGVVLESQFRGAAVFGNDRAELYDRQSGIAPWNLSLIDADRFQGTWRLAPDKTLASVDLRLEGLELTSEGLVQVSLSPPTTQDALPSADRWAGEFFALALRTPLQRRVRRNNGPIRLENAEIFPSPFLITVHQLDFNRSDVRLQTEAESQPAYSLAIRTAMNWSYRANEFLHRGSIFKSERSHLLANEEEQQLDVSYPYPVWLMCLKRSHYTVAKFWGIDANQSVDLARSGLVWHRHPTCPSVQSLPLTQNTVQANHLSASRGLFPFQLKVEKVAFEIPYLRPIPWTFQWSPESLAFDIATADTANELSATRRLGLAPLGLPGLMLGLHGDTPAQELKDPLGFLPRVIVRHDLPLLDQVNALADPPSEDTTVSEVPSTAKPLQRDSYEDHFQRLEDRAVLAEVDEAEAVFKTNIGFDVRGLMEPHLWSADWNLNLTSYPGNASLDTLQWSGEEAGKDALRGVDAKFALNGNKLQLDQNGSIKLVAGSMSALPQSIQGQNGLRDQRGLVRMDSSFADNLLVTPLVQKQTNADKNWKLVTTYNSLTIQLAGGKSWNLWFRGLPTNLENQTYKFDRKLTLSDFLNGSKPRRGVNDPASDGRDLGPLNDYQWRLGVKGSTSSDSWISLGPFIFFPLSIESAELSLQGSLKSASIIGRLQLPCWNGKDIGDPSRREFTEYDSAVVLTIVDGKLSDIQEAPLELDPDTAATPVSPRVWPLVDTQLPIDRPLLRWNKVRKKKVNAGLLESIELKANEYSIQYSRHGLVWQAAGSRDCEFSLVDNSLSTTDLNFTIPVVNSVGVSSLKLKLDLTSARHQLTATWNFRLGTTERLMVEAEWNDQVLFRPTSNSITAKLKHANREMRLNVTTKQVSLDDFGLSLAWNGFNEGNDPRTLQLLPGFHLAPADANPCRGIAMLAFARKRQVNAAFPEFELTGAYFDVLFECVWGQSLQEALELDTDVDQATVFGSSSGRVQAEFHSTLADNSWPWELSLSGLLEIKNAISWPANLVVENDGDVVVPKRTDATGHHWRHTARVLLSEHRISSAQPLDSAGNAIVIGSSDDNTILTLAPGIVWTLPANVQHQLVRIQVDSNTRIQKPVQELRWSLAQEIRIAGPRALYNHLVAMLSECVVNTNKTTLFNWDLAPSREVLYGLSSRVVLRELSVINDFGATQAFQLTRLSDLQDCLIVDASGPFFLNKTNSSGTSSGFLQSIAGGMIVSQPSARGDFAHDPTSNQWLFSHLPFLGRLQTRDRDTASTGSFLARDPVDELMSVPANNPVSTLLLAMTSRAGDNPISVHYSKIDRATLRSFKRLDPSSIDEAWFRLFRTRQTQTTASNSQLPKRTTQASVSDTLAASAKPELVRQLFDPRRISIPPRELPSAPLEQSRANAWIWTPASIATWNAKIQDRLDENLDLAHPFAFLPWIVGWRDAGLLNIANDKKKHTSATLIPTPKLSPDGLFQPVSLAVSAYTSIGFQNVRPNRVLLITAVELLVFDATRQRIEIAAETTLHPASQVTDDRLIAWGQSIAQSKAFDTPAVVVRTRKLFAIGEQQGIQIEFGFLEVPYETNAVELSRRTLPVQVSPQQLRLAHGQYGGTVIPTDDAFQTFELAPPLVFGCQPMRYLERPSLPDSVDENGNTIPQPTWPWGLSAIRLATRYRAKDGKDLGTVGVRTVLPRPNSADPQPPMTIWWQGCSIKVQYAIAPDRTLLPDGFRTRAVPGFLPNWHTAQMPEYREVCKALQQTKVAIANPVLPGRRRIIASGLRPGAPYAFRESLLTQTVTPASSTTVNSLTVPVQHRAPRPVLLPRSKPNQQTIALQTWGSWFDLYQPDDQQDSDNNSPNPVHRTLLVNKSPTAEFIVVRNNGTAEGVRITAVAPSLDEIAQWQPTGSAEQSADKKRKLLSELNNYPSNGNIPAAWHGKIILRAQKLPDDQAKPITLELQCAVGGSSIVYALSADQDAVPPSYQVWIPSNEKADDVVARARLWPVGQLVEWKLSGLIESGKVTGYKQSAVLLHRVDERPFASPLAPQFLSWEDPEFNRRLTSLTARKEFQFQANDGPIDLALVADRREYNSTGKIAYAVVTQRDQNDVDVSQLFVKFEFKIARSDGSELKGLEVLNQKINAIPSETDLTVVANNQTLIPGDVLRIVATVTPGPADTRPLPEVNLNIVKLPVVQTPEAAYGVLRRLDDKDACVRFAWGPDPTRMELLDPDDLKTQVVRRRAVYTAVDIVCRGAQPICYAIQKSAPNGATHFPDINIPPT